MAYAECIRIAKGHYRIRATSDEVKQLDEGKWQLLDPAGDEIGILASKKQAVGYSKKRGRLASASASSAAGSEMPPMQPRSFEELAQVLNAIRPPSAGHHYVVIEVSNQLTG